MIRSGIDSSFSRHASSPDVFGGRADHTARRRRMVNQQLAARDITDPRVLEAMAEVPRHLFVVAREIDVAYDDRALPLSHGATISQPYIVALMSQALRLTGSERVLEIGTGSGYGAAVLSKLAAHVVTVEIVPELAEAAARRLGPTVEVIVGDGSDESVPTGPFDAISVTATADEIPPALVERLAAGGRMVIPLAGTASDTLTLVTKTDDELETEDLCAVRFVPLQGRHRPGRG